MGDDDLITGPPAQGRHPTRDVVLCGVGFLLATCAYYVTSAYQGAVNKQLGLYALAMFFAAYGCCSLVVPALVRAWPTKYVFMVGAFFHVLYVAASIYVRPASIIVAAALGGLGAAVMWPVSGMFITRKSTMQTLGRNNGIFWTIYVTSIPAGNIFASVFLIIYDNTKALFIIMAIIGMCSLIPFFFLEWKDPPASVAEESAVEYVWTTVSFLWNPRFLLFTIYIAYSGGIITLVYGLYGPAISPSKYIGFGVAAYGIADVVGGMAFGPFSDRVGRVPVLVIGFILSMASIAVGSYGSGSRLWPLFVALVLLGFADAANQTQITAILPVLAGDPKWVGAAFGWRSFVGAVCQAILYGISGLVSAETRQVIIVAIATIGNVILLFEDRFYMRLTPPTKAQLLKARSMHSMRQLKAKSSSTDVLAPAAAAAAASPSSSDAEATPPPSSTNTAV